MKNKVQITWQEIYARVAKLPKFKKYYGVPRGGSYIAAMTGKAVMTPQEADIIIDDLIDSGATKEKYRKEYPDKSFHAVFNKQEEPQLAGHWLEFPWEQDGGKECEENVTRILQYIGEDTTREGLKDTPKRYIKFLKEFISVPEFSFTTFQNEGHDEMVVQSGIPFFSLCEHHLAPFFGVGAIAYIPGTKIVGLSKLARTLEYFSRRPQNQERITTQVANFLNDKLKPEGVAVVIRARHLCVEMRGVRKHNTYTTTSCMLGTFKKDINCRQEFLKFIENDV